MKKDINPQELKRKLDSGEALRVIDVRMPMEFAGGHIPGAVNVPLTKVGGPLEGVGANEQIVVVCQAGSRSAMACQKLAASHSNLYNLVGGTGAWKAAGLPVDSTPREAMSLSRQTHLVAGLMLAAAFSLSHFVQREWIYLGLLPAFGLLLDATTGLCPMTLILKKMPWNASASC